MRVSMRFMVGILIAALAMGGLALGPTPPAASAQVEQHYLLLGVGSVLPANLDALVASVGGRVITAFGEIGVALVASADPAFRIAAASLPGVQSVVPDATMGVDEAGAGDLAVSEPVVEAEGVVAEGVPGINIRQWNLLQIRADQAWSRGQLGSGVTVAVIDSGIDYLHQELLGKVDMNLSRSLIGEQVCPAPTAQSCPDVLRMPFADTALHGTHIASVIAGKGVAFPGVAPQARLISVKVLDRSGTGQESTVIAGILYAARIKADIINMSLGFTLPRRELGEDDNGEDERVQSQQLEALLRAIHFANERGALMVASAGNCGGDPLCKTVPQGVNWDLNRTVLKAPAGVKPVVGVSATTPLDTLAFFSDYGRSVVTVAAPGTLIFGAANTLRARPMCRLDNGVMLPAPVGFPWKCAIGKLVYAYVAMSGTSQAAAHASGVAALIAGVCRGLRVDDGLRNPLRKGTVDLGKPGPDEFFGSGRVDALKAVTQKIECDRHDGNNPDDDD